MVKGKSFGNLQKVLTIKLLIVFFILISLSTHTHAVGIDTEVFEQLKTKPKVLVTVVLDDDSNISFKDSKLEKRVIFENKKKYFEEIEGQVISTLAKDEFDLDYKFSIMNAFSGYITTSGLNKLKLNSRVMSITIDRELHLLMDESIKIINANDANRYFTGNCVTVCVIDGGIDWTHPSLGGCFGSGCKVLDGYDYYSNDNNPMDNFGHCTHVAGIVASTDGKYRGVAPDSKLIAMKVCSDTSTSCNTTAIQKGVDWCVNNASLYDIKVLTISIGDNISHSDPNCLPTNPLSISINNAYDAGFFISVASGSDGYTDGISWPACTRGATSVGATDKNDNVWSGTNRDEILNLLAPGVDIRSTNEDWEGLCNPFNDVGCNFVDNTGTSMATPHAAGIGALIHSAVLFNQFPFEIKNILKETGKLINVGGGLYIPRINALAALQLDWPAENHDFRRTGFTLLKGDLTSASKVKNQINLALDAVESTEQVVKPTVADLDNNGFMDSVVLVHKTTFNTYTKMYGVENQKIKLPYSNRPYYRDRQKWGAEQIDGGAIWFPASLGNIDSDSRKEIVTGTRNGTVYAYDVASNGKVSKKWAYYLEKRFAPLPGTYTVNFNGGTAIADIDLDGTNEIIFADVGPAVTEANWDGKVYVLDGSGSTPSLEASASVGNGGTYASISVANVDSDDYPEIIVPTQYGIRVYDYSGGSLSLKCSNSHGLIEGSAVVYDVDRDNEYELVYVTSNRACASGKTCANKLYVINASSRMSFLRRTFTEYPRPTPTVANLDSDSQSEIIVSSVSSLSTGLGTITAVDSSSGTTQWSYTDGGNLHPGFVSPNVADIDNDGNYNIILGENNGNTVYILNHTGKLFFGYPIIGFIDNGLAIADLDNDGMAEIALKRAASPETVFVSISAINTPPEITKISNVTAIAGNLINISNLVSYSDSEGNGVNLFYSSPFNSSGQWQTTINDTGNYSILVEATDGNLTTTELIDVIVFNETTKVI